MLKAIEICMDNAQKMHLIIEEIKKYAIKAKRVKTIKAYDNNMKKVRMYCSELTAIMGKITSIIGYGIIYIQIQVNMCHGKLDSLNMMTTENLFKFHLVSF